MRSVNPCPTSGSLRDMMDNWRIPWLMLNALIPLLISKSQCDIVFHFLDCNVKTRKIKRHVLQSHLSKLFSDVRPVLSISENELCSLQITALEFLVNCILRHKSSLILVINYVNGTQQIPSETNLHPDTAMCIKRLCNYHKWEEPPD